MIQVSKESSGKNYATGRTKTASARIWIKKGTGNILINGKSLENYFSRNTLQTMVLQPFAVAGAADEYDVICKVSGSGLTGQARAIRHGISKALDAANPVFHKQLRNAGLLTRDSRIAERKKAGQKKARKKFQFSKR